MTRPLPPDLPDPEPPGPTIWAAREVRRAPRARPGVRLDLAAGGVLGLLIVSLLYVVGGCP